VELLDRIAAGVAKGDRARSEPGAGNLVLELKCAEQLEPVDDLVKDEELSEPLHVP
jgi:hypothetical protein